MGYCCTDIQGHPLPSDHIIVVQDILDILILLFVIPPLTSTGLSRRLVLLFVLV